MVLERERERETQAFCFLVSEITSGDFCWAQRIRFVSHTFFKNMFDKYICLGGGRFVCGCSATMLFSCYCLSPFYF